MRWNHVHIDAVTAVLPDEVVSSADLEQRLEPVYARFGLHVGRLELMTGIVERRFWPVGTLPSQASAEAGRRALASAGAAPQDIEFLVHTAVSRDCLEPATASFVHDRLGLPPTCMIFDISNACLGFANGMIMLANMIELGQVRRGLIVSGENSRNLVESTVADLLADDHVTRQRLKDSIASLTIGSGAAAMVLAHSSVARGPMRLTGGVVRTATEHNHLCRGTADTGFDPGAAMLMATDSETLMVRGVELADATWRTFCEELGWSSDAVSRVYCHQVGVAQRDRMLEACRIDPAKDYSTYPFLGNTGSAAMPMTMALGLEQRPARSGEKLALLGIGSGLSCVMLGAVA